MKRHLFAAALLILCGCTPTQYHCHERRPQCHGGCKQYDFKTYKDASKHGCGGMCQ